MLYFNEWGIATLVCTLYTLVLLLYLISLKDKQLYQPKGCQLMAQRASQAIIITATGP